MLEKHDMAKSETEKWFHEPFPLVSTPYILLLLVCFLELASAETQKPLSETERSFSPTKQLCFGCVGLNSVCEFLLLVQLSELLHN